MAEKTPDISTITAARLRQYELFSDQTIASVAKVAAQQARANSYQTFFQSVGIGEPRLHKTKQGSGVPVVDIAARRRPEKGVLVVHLPMANPLDPNQLYHLATIAAANPSYRVIGFGNPSGIPYWYREQNLHWWQRLAIAFTNHLKPLIAAENDYLRSHEIANSIHIGYSYGAHKAMISAYYSTDKEVKGVILVDPVAHSRGVKQLLGDFRSTFHTMGEYVNRTSVPGYLEARRQAIKGADINKGLKRQINLAIGLMLSRVDFIPFLRKVLAAHPHLTATVAWGSHSELGNDAHMKASLHDLAYTSHQVTSFRLKDDTHSLGNDIHLYAAIIHEALELV